MTVKDLLEIIGDQTVTIVALQRRIAELEKAAAEKSPAT